MISVNGRAPREADHNPLGGRGASRGVSLQSSPGSGPQEAFEAAALWDSRCERQTPARPRSRSAKRRPFVGDGCCRCLDLTMPPNCPDPHLWRSLSAAPCTRGLPWPHPGHPPAGGGPALPCKAASSRGYFCLRTESDVRPLIPKALKGPAQPQGSPGQKSAAQQRGGHRAPLFCLPRVCSCPGGAVGGPTG